MYPPEFMQTGIMRKVMGISRTFVEKGENWALYLSRQDARRVQITMESEAATTRLALERERMEKAQARAAEEQARAALARERAENERLRQLLQQMGADPDLPKQT